MKKQLNYLIYKVNFKVVRVRGRENVTIAVLMHDFEEHVLAAMSAKASFSCDKL
jgi:hypothetical protein